MKERKKKNDKIVCISILTFGAKQFTKKVSAIFIFTTT